MSKEIIAAALLVSTAPAAWADLSAPDVWADWQSYMSGLGGTLTAANEDYADGTLTLTDVSTAFEFSGQTSESLYSSLSMIEEADGTIRVVLPDEIAGTNATIVDGETFSQDFTIAQQGADIVIREGDAGERFYTADADRISYALDNLAGLQDAPQASVELILEGMTSEAVTRTDGATTLLEQTASITTMTSQVTSEEQFDLNYVLSDVDIVGDMTVEEDQPSFLAVGSQSAATTTLTHKGATLAMSGRAEQGPFDISAQSTEGQFGFSVGPEQLIYDLQSGGGEMDMTVPTLPVPLNVTLGSAESRLVFPVSAGEKAQPYSLRMAYRELALDDTIWSLFDPTGQLPRDPATLVVDMEGLATVTANFMDPESLVNLQGPPILPQTLTLSTLNLVLAGAELTGSGDLSFGDGGIVPQPTGTIQLALDGGFALLDGLVAMGVVPEQQAGFIRGMSGAVAQQVGDDRLETEIELTPEGGIIANGMPLR